MDMTIKQCMWCGDNHDGEGNLCSVECQEDYIKSMEMEEVE